MKTICVLCFALGLAIPASAAEEEASQENERSAPYALPGGESLSLEVFTRLVGPEFESAPPSPPLQTEVCVKLLLQTGGVVALQREIAQQSVSRIPRGQTCESRYPMIRAANQMDGGLAVLYSVAPLGFSEHCHYVRLEDDGVGGFRLRAEMDLLQLTPICFSTKFNSLKELRLEGLETLHLRHQDGFKTVIRITADSRVTINGRPASPGGVPIRRLNYPYFLHALSPSTAEAHGSHLSEPKEIPWWGSFPPREPFKAAEVLNMSRLIDWISPPKIDPASITPEMRAREPKAEERKP